MTLEELQAEVTRLTQHVLDNENKLNEHFKECAEHDSTVTALVNRVLVLEDARRAQIRLNTEMLKEPQKVEETWFDKLFKKRQ